MTLPKRPNCRSRARYRGITLAALLASTLSLLTQQLSSADETAPAPSAPASQQPSGATSEPPTAPQAPAVPPQPASTTPSTTTTAPPAAAPTAGQQPATGPEPLQPGPRTVPQMSSPTDQPPPEVPLPRPIRLISRALIDGDLDTRYRTSDSGRSRTIWLQSEEVDVTYPIVTHGVANGNVVIQAMGENPPDIQN